MWGFTWATAGSCTRPPPARPCAATAWTRRTGGGTSRRRGVSLSRTIDELYRKESRRVFATLVRLLGDFDLAEEALAEAFRAALEQWPKEGLPANPRAWLVSAGRFKAIDAIRRRARFDPLEERHAESFFIEDS